MAEEQDKAQKTEEPTPKRREEAREKGQIPTSREIGTAALFLAALGTLYLGMGAMGSAITVALRDFFRFNDWRGLTLDSVVGGLETVADHLAAILLPLLFPLAIAVFMAGVLQTQMNVSIDPIKPKVSKISPIKGLQRIFSMRGLMEFFKSVFKVAMLAGIGAITLLTFWRSILGTPAYTVAEGMAVFHDLVGFVLLLSVVLFLILAALDYGFQVFQNEEELRMTKREVQEEQKQSEGDPQVKQQRQQKQKEMAQGRMMAEVPESDVVITNPTHLAVALKYDRSEAPAPKVLAMGSGYQARRIRELADEAGVAVVRRPPVARVLYDSVEVGDIIPEDLYQVIAQILAWVYDPANQPRPEGVETAPTP